MHMNLHRDFRCSYSFLIQVKNSANISCLSSTLVINPFLVR